MNTRTKTNIRFNGREYANADEMPSDVRAAYDRAVYEMPSLHSGARLAAKVNAKIIVNGNEFNNAGEMSVEDHEALAAMFPASVAVSVSETRKIKPKKVWLIAVVVSNFCRSYYLWRHGFFG